MKRYIAGAGSMMLLMTAGLFLWIGASGQEPIIPDTPPPPESIEPEGLPESAANAPAIGTPPPTPPKAYTASREERRFNRYDRNRDEKITRLELMSSRTKAFKALDTDGNNLLTFEEWAVATSNRFAGADTDGDGHLTRSEFRTTRPKRTAPERCRC
ncbi:EF-hand domain-containing protein [Parasphingorhabdus sp.]|uniref:EF-hand domain-containing protein n=1 Tax=Parasphingorhabdus sp. TaxID=2709688 RepID=UPI003BAF58B4